MTVKEHLEPREQLKGIRSGSVIRKPAATCTNNMRKVSNR